MSNVDMSWHTPELKKAFTELQNLQGDERLLHMEKIDALRRKSND